VVVDPDRALLYTRSKGSMLTVYDLGLDGGAAARRVAEFRGASASGGGKTLAHMAVVSPSESSHLHLVAVATDGTRLYLTTASSYNRYAAAPAVSALAPGQCTCRARPTQRAPKRVPTQCSQQHPSRRADGQHSHHAAPHFSATFSARR